MSNQSAWCMFRTAGVNPDDLFIGTFAGCGVAAARQCLHQRFEENNLVRLGSFEARVQLVCAGV